MIICVLDSVNFNQITNPEQELYLESLKISKQDKKLLLICARLHI